jgi:hypothetical protein
MASTTSQIKAGLDEISKRIAAERTRLLQSKSGITTAKTTLAAMPTQLVQWHADSNFKI